jgi:hypothetical protein
MDKRAACASYFLTLGLMLLIWFLRPVSADNLIMPPLSESVRSHDLVVVGRVVDTTQSTASFSVVSTIKGLAPNEVMEFPHLYQYELFSTKKTGREVFTKGDFFLLMLVKKSEAYVIEGLTSVYSLGQDGIRSPYVRAAMVFTAMFREKSTESQKNILLSTWHQESEATRQELMESFLKERIDPAVVVPFLTQAFVQLEIASNAQLAEYVIAHHQYKEAIPSLLQALNRKHWSTIYAARTLGKLACTDAYDQIMALINDPKVGNREYFIEALGYLKDRRSVPFLLTTLYRRIPELDENWREITSWSMQENIMAARALGSMRETRSVPCFRRILELSGYDWYKEEVIDALGQIGPGASEALPVLERLAIEGSNNLGIGMRYRAKQAIEQITKVK